MAEIDKKFEGESVAVTPSDATVFNPKLDGIYVGTTGDVAYKFDQSGPTFTLKAVPAGSMIRIAIAQVLLTGTTAADIVGFR